MLKGYLLFAALAVFVQISCLSHKQSALRFSAGEEAIFDTGDFSHNETVAVKDSEMVNFSAFEGNERRFQPAQMEDFIYPIAWLSGARKFKKEIYLVKQVGTMAIFCLIKPAELGQGSKKRQTTYSVFVIRTVEFSGPFSWEKIAQERFGADAVIRRLELGEFSVQAVDWPTDRAWQAPATLWQKDGQVYETALLYRGLSRTYVNQILNKFPWRVLALRTRRMD